MGFKLPGKSITSGTSAHRSALKMKEEANAASALKYTKPKEPTPPPKEKDPNIGKKGLYKSDKSWAEGQASAKASGRDLDALVKQRGGLKKDSDEYNVVQNQINRALGNKKVHGETKTTEGKTTTTVKPGIRTTAKTTKRGEGNILGAKTKVTTEGTTSKGDKYTKTTKLKGTGTEGEGKTIMGVGGVRKAKTTTTTKKATGDRDVKLKTKYSPTGEITKKKTTVKEGGVVIKTKTKDDKTKRKTRKKGGIFSKRTKKVK